MGIWWFWSYTSAIQLLYGHSLYGSSQLRTQLRKGKVISGKGGQQIKGTSNTHNPAERPNKCDCTQWKVSRIQKQAHRNAHPEPQ